MQELAARLRTHPEHDPSLTLGGIALALACAAAFARMEDSWAAFPLLLLVAIPCAVLFGLALLPGREGGGIVGTRGDGALSPWQSAFLVIGILLLAGTLFQLVRVLGEDDPGSATATWVFLVTGAVAAAVAVRLDFPASTLLAALSFAIALLAFADWVGDGAGTDTVRNILLVEGLLFLLAARWLHELRIEHSHVLVSVGALALVAGAIVGILGDEAAEGPFGLLFGGGLEGDSDGWELVLLVVSIGALAYAAWQRYRGSAYVGAVGIFAFLNFVAEGSLVGWPLLLALVAAAAFGWALYGARRASSPGVAPPAAPPPRAGP